MKECWINTVFEAISRSDSQTALTLLKSHKEELEAGDEDGFTLRASLLHQAIQYSCYSLIAFTLNLASPPDIHFYRLYGNTPIAYALEKNDQKALNLLYAKSDKNFALHTAVRCHQKNLVEHLLSKCTFPERLLSYLALKK